MRSFSGQPLHRSDASINRNLKWEEKDKEELLSRGQSRDWKKIGKHFKRTPLACYTRYVRLRGRENNHGLHWTANDDKELLCRGQSGDWDGIGEYFKRTPDACWGRYGKLKGHSAEPRD